MHGNYENNENDILNTWLSNQETGKVISIDVVNDMTAY